MTGGRADVEASATADLRLACDGDRGALARTLSNVERGGFVADVISRELGALRVADQSHVIGVTGPPGIGKSTLTSALAARARAMGDRVAVLAVDPTSPFTGGAILGDRVRMEEHAGDPGVFIRSLATRGEMGGLSAAAAQAVRVLRAVGFPWVLLETVGVGQVQVAGESACDTSIVVLSPGAGDSIQANKSGLMETGDVLVVNKADLPGAERTRRDVEQMLMLSPRNGWNPPVLMAAASTGQGVPEIWAAVLEHRTHLGVHDLTGQRRRAQQLSEVQALVADRLRSTVATAIEDDMVLLAEIGLPSFDPRTAADRLTQAITGRSEAAPGPT